VGGAARAGRPRGRGDQRADGARGGLRRRGQLHELGRELPGRRLRAAGRGAPPGAVDTRGRGAVRLRWHLREGRRRRAAAGPTAEGEPPHVVCLPPPRRASAAGERLRLRQGRAVPGDGAGAGALGLAGRRHGRHEGLLCKLGIRGCAMHYRGYDSQQLSCTCTLHLAPSAHSVLRAPCPLPCPTPPYRRAMRARLAPRASRLALCCARRRARPST
jgi:hypothetical protein